MSIELDEQRMQKLRDIEEKFLSGKTQESKNKGSAKKSSLWEELLDIPFECNDFVFGNSRNSEVIIMPNNLGLFLKDIAGNDLWVATKILRLKEYIYCPVEEASKREELIRNLKFLNVLCGHINISRKRNTNPLKPKTKAFFSNDLEEEINKMVYHILILDDIDGLHRFNNIVNFSGKRFIKQIFLNRCLLCPGVQTKDSYLCEFHYADKNGNDKRNIRRGIERAFNSLMGRAFTFTNYTAGNKNVSLAAKAYSLHNWAKMHPIQKRFANHFRNIIAGFHPYDGFNTIPWRRIVTDNKEKLELEKAYRSHPFAKEFNYQLNFKDENLIDLCYSASLASEHALIKIAGNKDLRKTYSFSDTTYQNKVLISKQITS